MDNPNLTDATDDAPELNVKALIVGILLAAVVFVALSRYLPSVVPAFVVVALIGSFFGLKRVNQI